MKSLTLLAMSLISASALFADTPATEIKHTSAKDAQALLEAKDAKITVIDVRTPEEFAEGHIAGAKNLNFRGEAFEKKLAEFDKTQPILVHCAGGSRSTASLEIFKKLGFKTVIHLDGGFTDWKKAGQPVEK